MLWLVIAATENPFKGNLTSLPKPGGGEFGKFYSLPSLNDPRIGKFPNLAWHLWIPDTKYGTPDTILTRRQW